MHTKCQRQPVEAQIPIEYVEPEDGKFFAYANQVGYGFTPSDVRLIFGELIDFDNGKAIVEQRAQITIPWLQAKATAMTLMDYRVQA